MEHRAGIRAHDIGLYSETELPGRLAEQAVPYVQLTLDDAFGSRAPGTKGLNSGYAGRIRRAFAAQNVGIAVLSCYINPIHPDSDVRRAQLDKFCAYVRYARDFGCSLVATETGSCMPDLSFSPANHGAKAMALLLESLYEMTDCAGRYGVTFDGVDEQRFARDLFLLTNKPVLYVCNVDDASAATGNSYVEAVKEAIKDENAQLLIVAAQTEADIAELDTWEERQEFLNEIGLEESGVSRLIRSAYALLNLQTYFTAGPDEVRAWTFMRGSKAPQCAGIIHTDFEKGFIRAEVIKYDDYVSLGGENGVKEAGKLGIEGKEYVVQDGDIMHFRFNV